MSEPFGRAALEAWFGQLADGTLAPPEHARLNAALADSAEARKLWFQFCDVETGLADWAELQRLRESQPTLASKARITLSRPWAWGSALAICVAIVVAIVQWQQPAPETIVQGVAVLAHSADAQWDDVSDERSTGAVLSPGVLRLKSGAVLLDFYSGARLIIEGPAEVRLLSTSAVDLISGRIHAHVPPQASGFTVDSLDFRLIDRGTKFGMVVSAHQAEVHVFEGQVEIEPAQTPASVRLLNAGRAAEYSQQAWKNIPPDQSAFLDETQVTRREATGAQARQARWQQASRNLSEEATTVVHYRVDATHAPGENLKNEVPQAPAATHGRVVGCELVSGRWTRNKAVQFRSEGDRIRLRVEQPLQAITVMAWVRVQDLRAGLHSLLSADSDATGAVRWELSQSGQLRLAIARDLGRKKADWEAVDSAPFVTAERLGQWVLLVSTFDGKLITHYGNGEIIGSGASFQPPGILIGTADIGNWHGSSVRNLSGSIDEFAILSRAMTSAEVRELYEMGKP